MLMLEQPHFQSHAPLETYDPKTGKKFAFDAIDFRVENWGQGGGLSADPGHKKLLWFKQTSFSAKLPNGSYLNISIPKSNRDFTYAQAEATAVPQRHPAATNMYIGYDAPDNTFVIPDAIDWFGYAAFFLGDDLVKPPKVMREEDEANLARQEREGKLKPQFQLAGGQEVKGPVLPMGPRPTFSIAAELLK